MHATIEQLINLRDSAPADVNVLAHVESCDHCSRQLEKLCQRRQALLDLPGLQPSPEVFQQLTKRLNEFEQPTTQRRWQFMAAAVLVAAFGALGLMLSSTDSIDSLQSTEAANSTAPEIELPQKSDKSPVHAMNLDRKNNTQVDAEPMAVEQLRQRSENLEYVLAQLAELDSGSTSQTTLDAIDALQARLAILDYGMNVSEIDQFSQRDNRDLWQRRVSTLQSMVGVQHAELARQGYHSFRMMPAVNSEHETTW